MLEKIKTLVSVWWKKLQYFIFVILLILVLALAFFPERVFSIREDVFQNTDSSKLEVWVNLNREVKFVDKKSGKAILTLDPTLAKQVMVAQLKLYKLEELEALSKEP